MITQVRLIEAAKEMILYPRDGIAPTEIDLGFPEVREVTASRTDDDGETDTTTRHGARAIELTMTFYDQIHSLIDELKGFCAPRNRPFLCVTDDEWDQERATQVRVAEFTGPVLNGMMQQTEIQVQWRAPSGVWQTLSMESGALGHRDIGSNAGLTLPVGYPINWPAATGSTSGANVTNVGTAPVHYTARIYGACNAPKLSNNTTGEAIAFTHALRLESGQFLEISSRDRTAYLNGDTDLGQLINIDFDNTRWWRLQPGTNVISLDVEANTSSAECSATIDFYPAWI